MKLKLILTIAIGFLSMEIHAQNILNSTIEWSASGYTDLNSNVSETDAFTITTNSSEIVLTHSGRSRNFTVVGQQGSWNNLQTDGQLTCSVKYVEKEGVVTIGRESGQYFIKVDFSQYPAGMKRKFIISNYQEE